MYHDLADATLVKYYQVGGGETTSKGPESPEFEAKIGGFQN